MSADPIRDHRVKIGKRRLATIVYNALILLGLPLIIAFLVGQLAIRPRYRKSLFPRLGLLPKAVRSAGAKWPVIWIHAVSVGEVMAAIPLAKKLKARYPDGMLLVSTVTDTGQITAREKIPEADGVFYFPFDLPGVVGRVIRRVNPTLFVFLETEIWPNFLLALARRRVPAVLVNGRLSERSFRGYCRLSPFFQAVLQDVYLFLVQSDLDRDRLLALGVDPRKVVRTGNMKYDQALRELEAAPSEIRKALKIPAACTLLVAGSTHEGEEKAILACYERLRHRYADLRLLLAPRHLDRLEGIEGLIHDMGLRMIRKTKIESSGFSALPSDTVILLDTLGELQRLYGVGDLVFVGGSLVPIGGHNVLEPAACAKPIVFGPHMENFEEIARLLLMRNAACQVAGGGEELVGAVDRLLAQPAEPRRMGVAAREVVREQQGVVDRNLKLLQDILGQAWQGN